MIILPIHTTSLIHFSLKGWENVLFELESERLEGLSWSLALMSGQPFIINFKFLLQPHQKYYVTVWSTWLFKTHSAER